MNNICDLQMSFGLVINSHINIQHLCTGACLCKFFSKGPWLLDYFAHSIWGMNNSEICLDENPEEHVF